MRPRRCTRLQGREEHRRMPLHRPPQERLESPTALKVLHVQPMRTRRRAVNPAIRSPSGWISSVSSRSIRPGTSRRCIAGCPTTSARVTTGHVVKDRLIMHRPEGDIVADAREGAMWVPDTPARWASPALRSSSSAPRTNKSRRWRSCPRPCRLRQ
jgi:hypothetical protein